MEMDEALATTITTFELQGVDLSSIIIDGKGDASLDKHSMIMAIHRLQTVVATMCGEKLSRRVQNEQYYREFGVGETNLTAKLESNIVSTLNALLISCNEDKFNKASIAERHGGVEVPLAACKTLTT